MKIEEKSALLVIDIQQEDFVEMNESNMDAPEWECIRNAKKVLDVGWTVRRAFTVWRIHRGKSC